MTKEMKFAAAQMKRINEMVRTRNAYLSGLSNHPEFKEAARRIADQVQQEAAREARGIGSPVKRKAAFLISQIILILNNEIKYNYKNYIKGEKGGREN